MTQPIDPISNMAGHHLSYSICTVLVVLGDTMASAIARPSRQGNGISDNAMSPLLLLQRDCLGFFGVTIDGDGLDLGVTIIAARPKQGTVGNRKYLQWNLAWPGTPKAK